MVNKPKEAKVFAVLSATGEIQRLIQADSKAQVKAMVTPQITVPSALSVARLVADGMKVELAE